MEQSPDIDQTVLSALQQIFDRVFAEGSPGDWVRVQVDHDALDTPIKLGFSPQKKINALKLLLQVKKVQQSKRDVDFNSGMRITFTRIRMHQGGRPRQT